MDFFSWQRFTPTDLISLCISVCATLICHLTDHSSPIRQHPLHLSGLSVASSRFEKQVIDSLIGGIQQKQLEKRLMWNKVKALGYKVEVDQASMAFPDPVAPPLTFLKGQANRHFFIRL